ncbi:hypothetical protein [Actinomadura rubrisoli]|uniref:Uncharacterized protein n=1 Tax=Actinomadura rubrisoli TaxID=2530368 RepID=A0A4R5B634_9ACTN|nr:hypothetical protein [Actinomadura rubrisoli]TDD79856.1 hypothetical protein E1298_26920 [Actinomadura rubrisoli]
MTGPAMTVNPFALPEDPERETPPLNCRSKHSSSPECYVDVGDAFQNFASFEKRLERLGRLQETGLFVPVGGPSGSGKTSLINRCAARALDLLKEQGISAEPINLTGEGRNTRLTVEQRTGRVGGKLVRELQQRSSVFVKTKYTEPLTEPDTLPDLQAWMSAAHQAMNENSVAVVRTPSTELLDEIAIYWSGVYPRMLVFTESPGEGVDKSFDGTSWEQTDTAEWLYLEGRFIENGEVLTFIKKRLDIPGKGTTFPDLDLDSFDGFFGGGNLATVGAAQSLLYRVYQHGLQEGWRAATMVTAGHLGEFIREAEGSTG